MTGNWKAVVYHDEFVEVFPLHDLEEHLIGYGCWCNPRRVIDDESDICVHNSADRRELDEPDYSPPQVT